MNRGDRCIFLDEDWVLELPPIPRLGVVFGDSRAGMLRDYDGLVVHVWLWLALGGGVTK